MWFLGSVSLHPSSMCYFSGSATFYCQVSMEKNQNQKKSYFLQNDHLMVECTYNTSSKEAFTRGGFSARDEMCLVFMHYYPASNLAHCASRLSFQHVLLALGINVWPLTPPTRHLGLRIRDPWQYQNLTFR